MLIVKILLDVASLLISQSFYTSTWLEISLISMKTNLSVLFYFVNLVNVLQDYFSFQRNKMKSTALEFIMILIFADRA